MAQYYFTALKDKKYVGKILHAQRSQSGHH